MIPSIFTFDWDFDFFLLQAQLATGFWQDEQILPDSVEYTNRELFIYSIHPILPTVDKFEVASFDSVSLKRLN